MWMRGFIREPGQGWGEPIDILPPEDRPDAMHSTVATSERGDALVATSSVDVRGRQRVRVARRLPGGGFGAPEQLALTRSAGVHATELHAGYAASGEAIVTWAAHGPKENVVPELWAAIAPPGAPFGTPQRVGSMYANEPYALAVGADGRALAVYTSFDGVVVAERAPGAAFGAPITLGRADRRLGNVPVAVLRPGGGAVVAWTNSSTAGLIARTREQPGTFGPEVALVRPKRLDSDAATLQQGHMGNGGVRAAVTPDGRVMVTWPHLLHTQGVWRVVPGVALIGFSGTGQESYALGGGLRVIEAITPVTLADGSLAVAWSDNGERGSRGRIHVARAGTPIPADPVAPKVTVAPPRSRTLRDSDPLMLRVTCNAACDVQLQLADDASISASASLPAAGSRRLLLYPYGRPIAPRGGGTVRVLVRSSAPGARSTTADTLTLKLRRAKILYPPRVLDPTVARDGDDLIVRWRTAKPGRPGSYFVMASDERDRTVGSAQPRGGARTSFGVRIRRAGKAATVTVYAIAANADKFRRTTVNVPDQ
jgi:hypothetical protein